MPDVKVPAQSIAAAALHEQLDIAVQNLKQACSDPVARYLEGEEAMVRYALSQLESLVEELRLATTSRRAFVRFKFRRTSG